MIAKFEGANERIPAYPLLTAAIDQYEEVSNESVFVEEGEYDGVPCFLINSNIFPKEAGDEVMSRIVSKWQGGGSVWRDDYAEMVGASPIKDKLIARYGEKVFDDLPPHHPGSILGGFERKQIVK